MSRLLYYLLYTIRVRYIAYESKILVDILSNLFCVGGTIPAIMGVFNLIQYFTG